MRSRLPKSVSLKGDVGGCVVIFTRAFLTQVHLKSRILNLYLSQGPEPTELLASKVSCKRAPYYSSSGIAWEAAHDGLADLQRELLPAPRTAGRVLC